MMHRAGINSEPENGFVNKTKSRGDRGFNVIELLIVILIGATLTAVATPLIQSTLNASRLNSAVGSISGSIGTTRYQAIMNGFPYQLTFNATADAYQITDEPVGAVTFTNVGSAVPFTGTKAITLDSTTTLQFNPNGIVQFIAGGAGFALDQQTMTVTYLGRTVTITVSSVGNVKTQ